MIDLSATRSDRDEDVRRLLVERSSDELGDEPGDAWVIAWTA